MVRNLRKILVALIIVIFVLLPSTSWEMFPNLIPNSGFEEDFDRNGIPDHWYKTAGGEGFLHGDSPGLKDGKAVFIDGKGIWRCRINNIKPHRYYLFSLRIKRDGWRDGEYPEIAIFDKELYLNELFSWGGWIKLSWLIKSGDYRYTTLSLKSPGMSHRVWFDDLYLTEFTIQPVLPIQGETFKGDMPRFEWLLPEDDMIFSNELHLSQDENFRNVIILERFSPQGNSHQIAENLKSGKWYWKTKVYKNRNEIASSDVRYFTVESQQSTDMSPSTCNLKHSYKGLANEMLADFFPIGIYGADVKDLSELKEAGFNSVHAYSSDVGLLSFLILEAERHHLKLMIGVPGEVWERDITPFFSRVRNSPGILSWYLADEPEGRGIPPSYIWRLNDYVHKMDSTHPTSLVLVRSKKAYDYGDGVDILLVDPYPIPKMPITWLSESIDEARVATFGEKPILAVIQAFDWSAFPVGEYKREWGRNPTYEEERCLTYLAIVHGAKGIFYYTYKGGKYNIRDYPEHWEGIKRIVWELNQIYPLLLAPSANQELDIEIESENLEGVKLQNKPSDVHYTVKFMDNMPFKKPPFVIKKGMYIIAVNVSDKPAKVKMYGSFLKDKVNVVFENRVLSVKERRLADYFGPYEVHIYEM
jgi:hypothetical protein